MSVPPNIVVNFPAPFPTRVIGLNGISVTKVNGVWQIELVGTSRGIATLDFGAFPGGSDASLAVIGQDNINLMSVITAVITPVATADHSSDEHVANAPRVCAGNIIPGIGFTVYGRNDDWQFYSDKVYANGGLGEGMPIPQIAPRTYGKWSVAWSWQ
jgi:hypothetical protein